MAILTRETTATGVTNNDAPLTNAELDNNFVELKQNKVETGLATLDAIAKDISDTAVDVFVYDTRKDSDGGAWRKRCQHTSWYNETLNTATRGSRKEFPAVAVIVAESGTVTIYDGDDPDMPMWMVFNVGSGNMMGGSTLRAITALNGVIATASSGYTMETRFVSDSSLDWYTNQVYDYKGNIEQRNDGLGFALKDSYGLVNASCNDVAMTVLPNAPIDDATGLPIPTIAVATDGGVSVIKDDGSVVDITMSSSTYGYSDEVEFTSDNKVAVAYHSGSYYGWVYVVDIPASDESITLNTRDVGLSWFDTRTQVDFSQDGWILSDPNIIVGEKLSAFNASQNLNFATSKGLTKAVEDRPNGNNALHSYITSSYNTGWMNGDIKLATLSDTDDTDVTGSELVTNGTDWTDSNSDGLPDNWGKGANCTVSVVSGAVNITATSTNDFHIEQTITGLTVGKKYVLVGTYTKGSGNSSAVIGTNSIRPTYTTEGVKTLTFTAAATSDKVFLYGLNNGGTAIFDNISVRLAEEDRSVNGNGLQVFGTVTKNPVATGADLVAYSGFSASNYLQQPYNSDLDFGTGGFCVMGWVNASAATKYIFSKYDLSSRNGYAAYVTGLGKLNFWSYDSGTTESYTESSSVIADSTWKFFCCIRTSTELSTWINGKKESSTSISSAHDPSAPDIPMTVGNYSGTKSYGLSGSIALLRASATAPSAEQIAKIYEDEKVLFQENAKATLYGSSDAVTALAYDDDTNILSVGTSGGRSDFSGLRRVNNTTTGVTTAISASNELIVEQ